MTVKLLLDAKREGRELAGADVRALVAAYARGDVPDYQMAAFAMAVCCRGMTDAETLALTEAMRDSGACLSWDGFPPTADKHSTGGVGDKLSLVVQPLAAACVHWKNCPLQDGRPCRSLMTCITTKKWQQGTL